MSEGRARNAVSCQELSRRSEFYGFLSRLWISWTAGPRSVLLSGRHIHGGMPAHLEVLADLLNAV